MYIARASIIHNQGTFSAFGLRAGAAPGPLHIGRKGKRLQRARGHNPPGTGGVSE